MSHQISEITVDAEPANTNLTTKEANVETTGQATAIAIAEADLVPSLKKLLREHELDQNFPRDILTESETFSTSKRVMIQRQTLSWRELSMTSASSRSTWH